MGIVNDCLHEFSAANSVRLTVEVHAVSAIVRRDCLTQPFEALLRNALKAAVASADPKVKVTVRDSDNQLSIAIHDSGQGIQPDNRDRIFDPFFQEEFQHDRLGMGLTVAKLYADLAGGNITYQRQQGMTIFQIVLPIEAVSHSSPAHEDDEGLPPQAA